MSITIEYHFDIFEISEENTDVKCNVDVNDEIYFRGEMHYFHHEHYYSLISLIFGEINNNLTDTSN